MFASVERSYKDLQELVKPISFAPSVMCDLKTSSTWYTPGGNSTIARLYADAGANYISEKIHIAARSPILSKLSLRKVSKRISG